MDNGRWAGHTNKKIFPPFCERNCGPGGLQKDKTFKQDSALDTDTHTNTTRPLTMAKQTRTQPLLCLAIVQYKSLPIFSRIGGRVKRAGGRGRWQAISNGQLYGQTGGAHLSFIVRVRSPSLVLFLSGAGGVYVTWACSYGRGTPREIYKAHFTRFKSRFGTKIQYILIYLINIFSNKPLNNNWCDKKSYMDSRLSNTQIYFSILIV